MYEFAEIVPLNVGMEIKKKVKALETCTLKWGVLIKMACYQLLL